MFEPNTSVITTHTPQYYGVQYLSPPSLLLLLLWWLLATSCLLLSGCLLYDGLCVVMHALLAVVLSPLRTVIGLASHRVDCCYNNTQTSQNKRLPVGNNISLSF